MGNARRYVIEKQMTNGSSTVTTTFDLTNSFSGLREDNTPFSYEQITLDDLGELTDFLYEQRLCDFLIFINIESSDDFDRLKNEACFEDISCDSN